LLTAICYNRTVPKSLLLTIFSLAAFASPQQEPKAQQPAGQPPVKLNFINACSPSPEDQAEIKRILGRVPARPAFSKDFEVTRGQATLKDAPDSRFVRLRRDMPPESSLLAAQYSMSSDETTTVETLVLRSRDTKDFHELALEDRVSTGAAPPASLLAVNTPVSRIRVERIGKGSLVLSRCPEADQSALEPLFLQASETMALYRKALGLRAMIQSDVVWLAGPAKAKTKAAGHAPEAVPK
jgi:hypothetical protein